MKKVYCVFDTETLGTFKRPFVYDLGMVIMHKGKILHRQRFLIKETLQDEGLKKRSADWFRSPQAKVTKEQICRNLYRKNPSCYVTWAEARRQMNDLLESYEVEVVAAYNLAFDLTALTTTTQGNFFRKEYKLLCIWNMACDTIFQQRTFQKVASREGWVSPAGNFRTNAEVAYRYITLDFQYQEPHTALEDALIEAEILHKCIRQKKRRVYGPARNCWRKVPKPAKKKGKMKCPHCGSSEVEGLSLHWQGKCNSCQTYWKANAGTKTLQAFQIGIGSFFLVP